MKCAGKKIDYESLKDTPCYVGLDIGRVADLTAMILLFPVPDESYVVKSFFWIPESKVRQKEDLVDYWVWKNQGLIRVIPGNMISSEELVDDIYDTLKMFKVESLAYDRWYSGDVVQRLVKKGFPMNKMDKYDQSNKNMSPPIRKMEELILSGRLNHEGNSVLRWMASNVVEIVDAGGSIRFSKEKSIERIDGMVALAMALGTEMSGPVQSAYTSRGIRMVEGNPYK
jgi:phage terminase large subunit-like protein